ncbi:uncharacterized protein LOC141790777 [Halichoeres trimaculatus]|uniref:uncharacterized protein LOC141790777 n=1 Tax=Halichoeres trimaculatus TaxID=147232 RepID=UPI003D9E363E
MNLMEMDDGMKEGLVSSDIRRRKAPSRCVFVCMGLLCALLLAGNIGQIVHNKKLSQSYTSMRQDQDELKRNYSSLWTDKERLQTGFNDLKTEKEQLQTNNSGLTTDKNDLKRNLSNLQREKNELKTQLNSMKTNRDELQTQFNSMRSNRDEVQTQFNSMRSNRDELQTQLNSMKTNRDELQTQFNSMKTNRDELQTQLNSTKSNRDELQTQLNSTKSDRDELQREKDQLQTRFNSLQMEKDQLQSNYSTLSAVKDHLKKLAENFPEWPCEKDWKKFNGSCYYVSRTKMNWHSSRSSCQAKAGDLAIINSNEERGFLVGLVSSGANIWIGLTDDDEEGTWQWVDGTLVTTTYWEPGQPNSSGGNQDCGEMVQRGEWNDDKCSTLNFYMCEKKLPIDIQW